MRTSRAGLVPLTLLATAALSSCRGTETGRGPAEKAGAAPAVEAVRARSGSVPLEERLNGVVKAQNQVEVRPEITARVDKVLVRTGARVSRGQPLVELRDDELHERLRQAEASVRLEEAAARGARARTAEVEAQAVRARSLAAESLVSRLELDTLEAQLLAAQAAADEAQARVEQARATLKERRSAVAKTVVRSPVDGCVGTRGVEPGMLAEPGTLLFQVGSLDELRVEVPLTGAMLQHVGAGQAVVIHPPAGEPIPAKLSRVSPFLAESSFSTTGEIDVPGATGGLRPGMFVNVDVLYGASEGATLVPASAIYENPKNGRRGVYVARLPGTVSEPEGGDAAQLLPEAHPVEFRPVEVVADGRDQVGVTGVREGEWVVTVGQSLLHDQSAERARVRPVRWERVLRLQGLQKEDLLRGFLEEQQRIARERGATPPSVEEFVATAGAGSD
jgi:RND family efflux transporter MFP subunit